MTTHALHAPYSMRWLEPVYDDDIDMRADAPPPHLALRARRVAASPRVRVDAVVRGGDALLPGAEVHVTVEIHHRSATS